jgi:hypothetical protein
VLTALLNVQVKYCSHQQCTNLVSQVRPGDYILKGGAQYTCGSSVQNLLHVIFLLPKILGFLLEFWKICRPSGSNWQTIIIIIIVVIIIIMLC